MSSPDTRPSNSSGQAVTPTTQMTRGKRLAAALDAKAEKKANKRGKSQEQLQAQVLSLIPRAASWIRGRMTAVLLFALVLVFVVVVVTTVTMINSQQEQQAGQLLSVAVETSLAPIKGEPLGENEKTKTFDSAKARSEAALKDFQKVSKRYPDSTAASWSYLGQAYNHFLLDQKKEAKRYAQKTLTRELAKDDPEFKAQALSLLAALLEDEGSADKAIEIYADLEKMPQTSFSTLGSYQRARVLASQNKKDEAATVLRNVVEKTKAARKAAEKNIYSAVPYTSTVHSAEGLLARLDATYVPTLSGVESPSPGALGEPSYGPAGDDKQAIDPETLRKLMEQLKAQQNQNPGSEPKPEK